MLAPHWDCCGVLLSSDLSTGVKAPDDLKSIDASVCSPYVTIDDGDSTSDPPVGLGLIG